MRFAKPFLVLFLLHLQAAKFGISRRLPHIVFILADDYGFNDISYHQNRKSSANPEAKQTTNNVIATPFLDKLASEGLKLENYYAQPLCSPTRGSILSGMFPSSSGLGPDVIIHPSSPYGLPANYKLLPQVLNEFNYSSHMVGKWHLGSCHAGFTPTGRGFKTFTGFYNGAENYYAPSLVGDSFGMLGHDMRSGRAALGHDVPPPYKIREGVSGEDCYSANSTACYSTIVFAEAARKVIENHRKEESPLFLYVAFQATHNPLSAPDVYREQYDEKIVDWPRRLFAGMATAMDEAVKNITDALIEANMFSDTVLIFSSDNGGEPSRIGRSNNYPLRGGKVTNFEGGVRVVGFIRGTDNPYIAPLPRGVRMNMMHVVDWLPTLCELVAGSSDTSFLNYRIDGVSQWKAIRDNETSPRRIILHNIQRDDDYAKNLPSDAIRVGDYKLFMRTRAASEVSPPPGFRSQHVTIPKPYNGSIFLFHIPSDPTESTNLAFTQQDKLEELIEIYHRYQTTVVVDLARKYGYADPAGDPKYRLDKTWGPHNGTNSTCVYCDDELDGVQAES